MDSIIGKKLDGRYEITELIGVGGMADVYKANDVMENRTVAVKILKPEFSENEEFVRRFRNESKAIAVLSHPNIVKIYDVGFTDEIQFIVMEYIDGITLKELIEQQGVLRWKDALKFVVQILKALQHAHDKGIVHRDIKPQNIMLFPDGTIKVMDFGIARFSRIDGKTLSDKTIGSVHYISPEQAKGEMTDERSDIYSVGVMLYEMLTGRKPFDGENPVAIAVKHMQETPVSPREIMPSIPESLEEIVLHAMERSPSRRYQSAAEMINDISAFKVNPSIVFGYKNSPAPASDEDAASTRFFKPVSGDSYDDEEDYDEDYDDYDDDYDDRYQEKQRSYVVPILLAVTVAVVIIA
ncbi:MAG: Stk1 family PASTA domain-containing Ser/Thr kinase, partial [Oscillospiraceae bacterium]|nr:Stk1 family PASTA domain-containing Ser/Thr kinase [Oscillospiraceae bacterium]